MIVKNSLRLVLAAIFVAALSLMAVPSSKTSAHHPLVNGSAVCNNQGNWDVTWNVANSESVNGTNRTMTINSVSRDVGIAAGTKVLPDDSIDGHETLPGTTTGELKLSVNGSWDKGGPTNVTQEGAFDLPEGGCSPAGEPNSAWPQTSYECGNKSYEITIIVTSGVLDHTESERPLKGQLTSESFDFDVTVVFKSGEPVVLPVHVPSLIEAGCGEANENFATPTVKYDCKQNVAIIDIDASEGATVEPSDHVVLALTGAPQTAKFTVTFKDGTTKNLEVKIVELKKACTTTVKVVPPVAGGQICQFQWHNIPANTGLWGFWTTGPKGTHGKKFNGWIMTDEKRHLLVTANKGERNQGWLIVTEGTHEWYVYIENNPVYDFDLENHGCYVLPDDVTVFDEGVAGSSMVVSGKGTFEIPAWHFSELLKEATTNGGIFNQTGGIVMVNNHIIVAHESQFPSVKVLKVGMTVRINGVQYVIESTHELDKTLAGIYAANNSDMMVITCNKDWSANMVFTLKMVDSDLIKYIM